MDRPNHKHRCKHKQINLGFHCRRSKEIYGVENKNYDKMYKKRFSANKKTNDETNK